MKIRIKFSKSAAMIFVGHLDMVRYFQKAMRRANVDIAYSGGFNPHQVMSFAAPLGVGIYSNGEYLDIEANSVTTASDMVNALQQQMVEGVSIVSVKMLPEGTTNAMASVAAAGYTVRFRAGAEPDFDYQNAILSFYQKESINVIKKTKKSEKELDLKPFIFELKPVEDGIYMLVDASSSGNIKPNLIMQAFFKENGKELGEFDTIITREDTYTNVGTEEEPLFQPLDSMGNDF